MTTKHTEQSERAEWIERLTASADWLEYRVKSSDVPLASGPDLRQAAAELRRLHAEKERDEALLRQALEALKAATTTTIKPARHRKAIAALRERLGEKT